MIKANELRIGNWISPISCDVITPRQVKSITRHGVVIQFGFSLKRRKVGKPIKWEKGEPDREYLFDEIFPIPITLEKLKKYGFTDAGHGEHILKIPDPIAGVEFREFFRALQIYGTPNYSVEHFVASNPSHGLMEYLHQLQNRYFSLTGIELPITIPQTV